MWTWGYKQRSHLEPYLWLSPWESENDSPCHQCCLLNPFVDRLNPLFSKAPDGTLSSCQLSWKSQLWIHMRSGHEAFYKSAEIYIHQKISTSSARIVHFSKSFLESVTGDTMRVCTSPPPLHKPYILDKNHQMRTYEEPRKSWVGTLMRPYVYRWWW